MPSAMASLPSGMASPTASVTASAPAEAAIQRVIVSLSFLGRKSTKWARDGTPDQAPLCRLDGTTNPRDDAYTDSPAVRVFLAVHNLMGRNWHPNATARVVHEPSH